MLATHERCDRCDRESEREGPRLAGGFALCDACLAELTEAGRRSAGSDREELATPPPRRRHRHRHRSPRADPRRRTALSAPP